jgi:predicted PurR-regulated permease PerM
MKNYKSSQLPIDVFLRILMISLLIGWCFLLARPFLVIIIWAVIISVAIYPIYNWLVKRLWGKRGLAVGVFVLIVLVMFALPSIRVARSLVKHSNEISAFINDPKTDIPPPNQSVKEWPVVGEEFYNLWAEANKSLDGFIKHHSKQITDILGWLLKGIGGVLADVFISVISVFIAGFLLFQSESLYKGTLRFTHRLIGEGGKAYVHTARDTIKSVVQGILLIALIQALLSYVGFALIGIKIAALLSVLVLILAVIQLPVILVTLPTAIYVFSIADFTPAIIFAVYMVIIGTIDNVLKPIFLGRGLNVPMIIILIGSLGGLVLHGILGLFVGAVVLAIGYQTYMLWLDMDDDPPAELKANKTT